MQILIGRVRIAEKEFQVVIIRIQTLIVPFLHIYSLYGAVWKSCNDWGRKLCT